MDIIIYSSCCECCLHLAQFNTIAMQWQDQQLIKWPANLCSAFWAFTMMGRLCRVCILANQYIIYNLQKCCVFTQIISKSMTVIIMLACRFTDGLAHSLQMQSSPSCLT